jgi:RNA polymerase sigma factor (sigma-70 family)
VARVSRYPPLSAERQALAAGHFWLAREIARRWGRAYPMLREELESAAGLGLVRAAQSHDPTRGESFGALARVHIEGAMKTAMKQWGMQRWWGEREPAPERRSLSADSERWGRVITSGPDRPVGADVDDADEVARLLRALPRREAELLRLVDLEGRTIRDAAAQVGCRKTWASRLCRRALAELRAVAERRA